MKKIQHRFKRVIGQLESANEAIDKGVNCNKLIPQLLAIKGAVDSAVSAYIEQSLDECADTSDPEQAKQLIRKLIKNI